MCTTGTAAGRPWTWSPAVSAGTSPPRCSPRRGRRKRRRRRRRWTLSRQRSEPPTWPPTASSRARCVLRIYDNLIILRTMLVLPGLRPLVRVALSASELLLFLALDGDNGDGDACIWLPCELRGCHGDGPHLHYGLSVAMIAITKYGLALPCLASY